MSVLQPKVSPDGRYLVCTMADHGNFPVFLSSSDLYVVDLQEGGFRRLEINSDEAESWHAWSSNSRWLVFSSKRRDGLFARPYFTYIDEEGRFHKPILLPQQDPAFYDSFIQTVNVPVLVDGRVEVSQRALARAILSPDQVTKAVLDPAVLIDELAASSRSPTEPYSSGSTP
jgi:dipeptidyl aminopeptidase/acylaminoacyl peptidase